MAAIRAHVPSEDRLAGCLAILKGLGRVARVRTVLLGDSHLARIKRELPRLGDNAVNAAVGGATVDDLYGQAAAAAIRPDDVVVVSIGTNDAAPWEEVRSERFGHVLEQFLGSRDVSRWVIVLAPGVIETRWAGSSDRTNALLDDYRAAATAAAASAGAVVIDPKVVLSALGSSAFASDGLHLSGEGYRALLPALIDATSGRP